MANEGILADEYILKLWRCYIIATIVFHDIINRHEIIWSIILICI
jgi:hypothetical protein